MSHTRYSNFLTQALGEVLLLHVVVEAGALVVRPGVALAARVAQELVERVLLGVLLAAHEHHVLQEVGQAWGGRRL